MAKLDVLHAAIIETARRTHPYEGHKLSSDRWGEVFADPAFKDRCNRKFDAGRRTLLGRSMDPSDDDYRELRDAYLGSLPRWQCWPSVRAFFFSLDADAQIKLTDSEPFLSEIVEDVVYEELLEQVEMGYLRL